MMFEYSMKAQTGGTASKVTVATATSAQSVVLGDAYGVVVTPSVDVFFRRGVNPVSVSDGTDQIMIAGNSYRLVGFSGFDKLAFIAVSAAGTVYLSPAA